MTESKVLQYLETYLDSQVHLHCQFDNPIKRISNWIKLLEMMRPANTPTAA